MPVRGAGTVRVPGTEACQEPEGSGSLGVEPETVWERELVLSVAPKKAGIVQQWELRKISLGDLAAKIRRKMEQDVVVDPAPARPKNWLCWRSPPRSQRQPLPPALRHLPKPLPPCSDLCKVFVEWRKNYFCKENFGFGWLSYHHSMHCLYATHTSRLSAS